jgi:oxalate decarboxylase/phosphoglucose isomerase-like protein (cupin superfamily)
MKTVEIKRLKDGMYSDPKTGWSAYPFQYSAGEGRIDVRGVHVVAIYPGQLRGNHYHKETEELLFIFSGKGMFYWEEEGGLMQHPVSGTPTIITIPKGIRHAFRNTGEDMVYLLAVREGDYDPRNPDVVKSELVGP